jgi:hypothetical protein
MNIMEKLLEFLGKLKKAKIWYRLAHNIENAISVEVAVPGQLWEVEFYLDGDIYVEKFKSDGKILSEEELNVLFRDFSD